MNEPAARGERGVSILAALVLMGMLGAAAVGTELGFSSQSQVAATTPAATTAKPVAPTKPDPAQLKKEMEQKCSAMENDLDGGGLDVGKSSVGGGTTPLQKDNKPTIEKDKCVAAIRVDGKAKCVGLTSTINLDKKQVESKPDASVPAGQCKAKFCDKSKDPKTCSKEKVVDGTQSVQQWATQPDSYKDLTQTQQKFFGSSLSQPERDTLLQAFGKQETNIGREIDAQQDKLDKAQTDYAAAIEKVGSNSDCAIEGSPCADQVAKARKDLEAEQSRMAELQEQQKRLAAAQQGLIPEPGVDPEKCNATGNACYPKSEGDAETLRAKGYTCSQSNRDGIVCTPPPGQTPPAAPPVTAPPADDKCKANPTQTRGCPGYVAPKVDTGCPGCNRDNTFPPDNTNNQNKSGMPDIASLLKGLMGGSPSSAPGAGNGTPQPAGTCSPSTVCGNNTLFSRNNQCVDTVMQQCPYGCSGTTCATTPQQNCATQPAQPDPAGCSAGTWKPTYGGASNACVMSWQCVPNGSGTGTNGSLTAQISCQPQVADVGMILAISYSCSAGTSVGTGFQTSGAQSGSATTTLMTPPSGQNTLPFGLACTSAGQTANAQCSVQVGKPSIVLVANPKQIDSGGQSALGWITSGMQSCVIGSPDIPAFTEQNSSNTSVNGTVNTPPLTKTATTSYAFLLHCVTLGGGTRDASTTVTVK